MAPLSYIRDHPLLQLHLHLHLRQVIAMWSICKLDILTLPLLSPSRAQPETVPLFAWKGAQ